MYDIKPTFDRSSIQVDLPTCMYKMKNINDISLNGSQQSNAQLTNGLNGAVSANSLPDISQQIENFLKVFNFPNTHCTSEFDSMCECNKFASHDYRS